MFFIELGVNSCVLGFNKKRKIVGYLIWHLNIMALKVNSYW